MADFETTVLNKLDSMENKIMGEISGIKDETRQLRKSIDQAFDRLSDYPTLKARVTRLEAIALKEGKKL